MGDESPFRLLPRGTNAVASEVARPVRGVVVLADGRIALLTQGGRIAIVGVDGRVTDLSLRLPGGAVRLPGGEHMELAAERGGSLLVSVGNYSNYGRVFRVHPDGAVSVVAGALRGREERDGRPATAVRLAPRGIHGLPDGGFLLAEGLRIRRVAADGTVTTLAGSGRYGRPRAGRATESRLGEPSGVAALPGGDVIFADQNGGTVWRISAGGTMRRVAGGGRTSVSHRGIAAKSASLFYPADLVPMGPDRFAIVTLYGLMEVRGTRIRKVIDAGYGTPSKLPPVWSGARLRQAWVHGLNAAVQQASGGWLFGSDDGLVMTTRSDGTATRFAVAAHTESLAGVWRRTVTVAATNFGLVRIVAQAGKRRVASARGATGPGLTTLRLSRRLPAGLLTLEVTAKSPSASASHRLRVFGRRVLPMAVARRAINRDAAASGGDIDAETDRCRRRGPTSVSCRTRILCECGTFRYATTMTLRRDGWLWGRYDRGPWFRLEVL